MKIGFIGLGIMGSRMALNLRKHHYEIIVHNRTKQKAEALLAQGVDWAPNPPRLAQQVDILFTMLSTPEAVQQMALGADGFLEHLKPEMIWIDCSTVDPAFSCHMTAEALKRQVHFVDAPVSGSKEPAEQGQLIFYVGGDDADVKICQPLFEAMGKKVLHLGGHGMGVAMKMVVNLLLGANMAAFAEALVLGQALGLAQEQLFDILLPSAVVAPALSGKRSKITTTNYTADFPLRWMQKDLHLIALTAQSLGVALPTANSIKELYALAMRAGLAEQDFAAIYQFLQQRREHF
jgi:3-hydroxyisobutyrate dehydrogenase-like beta-hydroxyacid dehydrogenase